MAKFNYIKRSSLSDKFITKKDWRYDARLWYRNKKRYRVVYNRRFRLYKGDVQDHGWFKKYKEHWWLIY